MKPNWFDSASVLGSDMAGAERKAVRQTRSGSLPAVCAALLLAVALLLPGDVRAQEKSTPPAPTALQPVPIAVIDFGWVIRESEAAKGIRAAIDARQKEFRTTLAGVEQQLRADEDKLNTDRQFITTEAFQQRMKALKERASHAQRQAAAATKQLRTAHDTAMNQVQRELYRICAEIAEQTGAGAVLFRSSIVIAVKTLEISEIALARLNERIPAVEVSFETAQN